MYIPEDYAALAPGLTNKRVPDEGGDRRASLEDWDIAAPPATRASLATKAARARCPSAGLQRYPRSPRFPPTTFAFLWSWGTISTL